MTFLSNTFLTWISKNPKHFCYLQQMLSNCMVSHTKSLSMLISSIIGSILIPLTINSLEWRQQIIMKYKMVFNIIWFGTSWMSFQHEENSIFYFTTLERFWKENLHPLTLSVYKDFESHWFFPIITNSINNKRRSK